MQQKRLPLFINCIYFFLTCSKNLYNTYIQTHEQKRVLCVCVFCAQWKIMNHCASKHIAAVWQPHWNTLHYNDRPLNACVFVCACGEEEEVVGKK